MPQSNGQSDIKPEDLSLEDKVDSLLQGQAEMNTLLEDIQLSVNEIFERVINLSLPGSGFNEDELDS